MLFKTTLLAIALTLIGLVPVAQAAPGCFGRAPTKVGTERSDQLQGTDGIDVIVGLGGHDRISGASGDDFICGGAGRDHLGGGGGDDHLEGAEDADALDGGFGNDVVSGGGGSDDLSGGLDDDQVSGGDGDDRLHADGVDPEEDPHDGNDRYDGGSGTDVVFYGAARQAVTADFRDNTVGGWGADALAAVEGVSGSNHSDTLLGDAAANILQGDYGDDSIDGGGGNDDIWGGAGNDRLDGGDGRDQVAFEETVVVNLAGRTATTGHSHDTVVNFEDVLGSYGRDILIGNETDNVLHGSNGRDTIRGLGGNDKLVGGHRPVNEQGEPLRGEPDVLFGGAGNDILDGAWGNDTADYGTSLQAVNASLSTDQATGEGTDELESIENLSGSGYDDTLEGDDERNVLNGRSGNDVVAGKAGDDTMFGGTGDDRYDGGDGIDEIDFGASTAPMAVDLTAGTGSGQGNDTLVAIENVLGSVYGDSFTGDASDNFLSGRTGPDVLNGAGGIDTIEGLKGDDTLSGGEGDDQLYDGESFDTVYGNEGNDYFRTGAQDDHFDGGAGVDTLDFIESTRGITADLQAGTSESFGEQGTDTLVAIENLWGTHFTDEFHGDENANHFVGLLATDQLFGRGGDDLLQPDRGHDVVDGGDGSDTVTFVTGHKPVAADLSAGFSSGQGSDTLLWVENIIGSQWPDLFRGDDASNRIVAGADGDIIEGLGGDDFLDGEDGFDTIDGGAGDDTCRNGESLLDCER